MATIRQLRLALSAGLLLMVWWLVALASGPDAFDRVHSLAGSWFGSPINASLLALWIISVFYHTKLGLQVVIEDYVHRPATKIIALLALNLLTVALAVTALVSIITISLRV